ncbi:hypothetical protein [Hyphomicrobium sulfonivorans]|uniref:hypothetical protein n=1 Tax=Hyphomicrobium sulfonivorans TaxID=121290 RepID=UPI00156E5DFD|nr:hypothetical protein [Hyphomicrobium sulfonivorans]MBI1650187.1 hypothetical protein [Hyphomicrobium sulfonivorans]NSL73103.1 hypothetical protein [Hyphomicrobium sulfonivorans]
MTTSTITVRHIRPLVFAVVASALFGATALRAEEPPFVGTWSLDPAQCTVGQENREAPLILAKDRYDQHESHCVFKSVQQVESDWTIAATCTIEGDELDYAFSLTVSGDTLTFTDSAGARDFLRCK